MRRAFVTLYSLIVLSLLLFGWGLDRVWQFYSPAKDSHALSPEVFAVLNYFLADLDTSTQKQHLNDLAKALNTEISIVQLDDFAQTSFADRINSGALTVVNGGSRGTRYYQKLPNSEQVIGWSQNYTEHKRGFLYDILLLAFYLLMALVIFIWIWPLSRDLAKLEKQTKILGYDSAPDSLHIGSASAVFDLASAFNRMAQRIRDLLTTQKEMTYAVSHELRTPLARMKFGLEMASELDDVARIKEKLKGVRDDVTEMDLLVNQLLAYAEFDQHQRSLEFQPGDLDALIHQLIQRIQNSSNQQTDQSSTVEFKFDNQLQGQLIYCEWYLIERALLNVLHNAQRFANTRVNISLQMAHGQYQVIVDDDGPGVPEADRERVFQSFVRLSNSVNSQVRGFGLGLSIVRRIMSWHGGGAVLANAPIGGARVILFWPVPI